MSSLGEETGVCVKAGLQPKEYFTHSGTDSVLLLNPIMPPVKSWCYSLSLSFHLLLERELSRQLF